MEINTNGKTLREIIAIFARKEISYPLTFQYCNKYMQKENGYISLANTFLTKGEKGAADNICFYKWLTDNKESTVTDLIKEQGYGEEFVYCIEEQLNGEKYERPNQKWHYLISYWAFKEYATTEEYAQKYKEAGCKWGVKPTKITGAFLDSTKIYPLKCIELNLWIAESTLGTEFLDNKGVTEEFIKNSDEEEVKNLISEILSETRVNF